jgi:hypothetical protein
LTTTERPSLGDGGGAVGGVERAPDVRHGADAPQATHDVVHGGDDLRVAGSLALHEHLLDRTVGEAGFDDHVAALGLAAAGRRLVEIALADLAAGHDSNTTNRTQPSTAALRC